MLKKNENTVANYGITGDCLIRVVIRLVTFCPSLFTKSTFSGLQMTYYNYWFFFPRVFDQILHTMVFDNVYNIYKKLVQNIYVMLKIV